MYRAGPRGAACALFASSTLLIGTAAYPAGLAFEQFRAKGVCCVVHSRQAKRTYRGHAPGLKGVENDLPAETICRNRICGERLRSPAGIATGKVTEWRSSIPVLKQTESAHVRISSPRFHQERSPGAFCVRSHTAAAGGNLRDV